MTFNSELLYQRQRAHTYYVHEGHTEEDPEDFPDNSCTLCYPPIADSPRFIKFWNWFETLGAYRYSERTQYYFYQFCEAETELARIAYLNELLNTIKYEEDLPLHPVHLILQKAQLTNNFEPSDFEGFETANSFNFGSENVSEETSTVKSSDHEQSEILPDDQSETSELSEFNPPPVNNFDLPE